MLRGFFGLACLTALTAFAAPVSAQVTVGSLDGGNCYPFSCGPSDGLTEYQEVYMSSAFPGSLSFNDVSFSQYIGGGIDSATYTVSFYLTSADVNTLSSDLASNEGAFLGTLGSFTLSGSMPAVLSLNGATIDYDPSMGNLLMDVTISNVTSTNGYQSFFNADYTQADVARAWNSSLFGDFGASSGALVTTFSTATAPEPSTWVLMALGFGGLSLAGYRRRAAVRA